VTIESRPERLRLEDAYREAASEYDETWENAASDGMDNESW